MMDVFAGLMIAHGTHGDTARRAGAPKVEIRSSARTVRDPVTESLWDQHLSGERALGIIPIREDDTCLWGAVDVDKYDLVHSELVGRLSAKRVPAVVCRTKSGGAHVCLFFSEPVPAELVVARLRALAGSLGHGDAEVFPKQTHLCLESGGLGNWLNMPYLGGDRTDRYAVREDGRGMSVGQFLSVARQSRMTLLQLQALTFADAVPELSHGPPCLEHLASVGIVRGNHISNNSLFAFGTLARRMQPEGWEQLLEDWNRRFFRPPMPAAEVLAIIRSLSKKDYAYKCGDQPLVSHCNLPICRSRKFGVGAGGSARLVESVQILDTSPPLFFALLRTGGTVECDARTLLDPREFQRAALTQPREVAALYKQDACMSHVQACVESATLIEAPREVSLVGQFEDLLEQFCTDRHVAEMAEDLLLGKPWRDLGRRRVAFRLRDLQEHLRRSGFLAFERGQITTRIREMGGGTEFLNIRGRGVNVWWVPEDKLQWTSGSARVPRAEETPL
jgi:hypothetical protein